MSQAIYLRRRRKILVPATSPTALPLEVATTLAKNLEPLGHTLSPAAIEACRYRNLPDLKELQNALVDAITESVGAHRQYRPMYPNFPEQVMKAGEAELYVNAIVHYLTSGKWLPTSRILPRLALRKQSDVKPIELGTLEEFENLFTQIAASNSSLSQADREDLAWFVEAYGDHIARLLPESVPQRENRAILAALLLRHTTLGPAFVAENTLTATDALRLAVCLSGGDPSLAKPTKFGKFRRAERRLILGVVEAHSNALEDMLRWKERWKRLGERLHPGEFKSTFPKAARAFEVLRNDLTGETSRSRVEHALAGGDVGKAIGDLKHRPGELARRLDHLLRLDPAAQDLVCDEFAKVAENAATPLLLNLRHHFLSRNDAQRLRVFFPKGEVAKAHAEPANLPTLAEDVCLRISDICERALVDRFAALPPLGRVFVDPGLAAYPIPFAVRSASKALRTLPRGSRVPIPDCTTLRFFLWWRNGDYRTDIDLSAALFNADFGYVDVVSYYNLKNYGGRHSGDIVDAPNGASEFIDADLARLRTMGVRYVVMSLNSYTEQSYVELPECFAGWMARTKPQSGEIYDPRTVQNRLDLTSDTKVAIPVIFDIVDHVAIWTDLSLRKNPRWVNNVAANLTPIAITLMSMVELTKPTLRDLFALHAKARGNLVESAGEAETVFSVEAGTPFELERVAADFLQ